jgi:hypothetical protein
VRASWHRICFGGMGSIFGPEGSVYMVDLGRSISVSRSEMWIQPQAPTDPVTNFCLHNSEIYFEKYHISDFPKTLPSYRHN